MMLSVSTETPGVTIDVNTQAPHVEQMLGIALSAFAAEPQEQDA